MVWRGREVVILDFPRTITLVFTFTRSKVLHGVGGQAGCHKGGEIGENGLT